MFRDDEESTAGSLRGGAQVRPDVPVSQGGIVAGKYRIDAVIGFGGAGIVCEGFHLDLETKVEVQIARREHVNDARAVARFLSEARAAAQLRSQHTRRVMDCGRLDVGAPYVVVEHLDGADLRRVAAAHGHLPVEEVMSFALQACEALGEAHSRGLVHGALTPDSLFLTHGPDGGAFIKVLDLGISKPLDRSPGSGTLTESADKVWLSHYVSPEQTSDPTGVDARTDIWSLGVILYELLTDKHPHEGSSVTQVAANVPTAHPVSPSEVDAAIPESLAAIVLRCMDSNRDARFPDATALGRALKAFGGFTSSVSRERVEEILRHARSPRLESETSQSVADVPESVTDMPASVADVPESVADMPESVADMPESVADMPESVADMPESVADVPESVADMPASVADVPESVAASALPRSIPALPVLPPPPRPSLAAQSESSVPQSESAPRSEPVTPRSPQAASAALQSESAGPQSEPAAPQSEPAAPQSESAAPQSESAAPQSESAVPQSERVTSPSIPVAPRSVPAAAQSIPAAARSVPAGSPSARPLISTGPPPLPPSLSPPAPTTPRRLLGKHGALFALVGVLLGTFAGLLASHHPNSERSRASASSAGAPVVAPAAPVIASAEPAAAPAEPAAAPAEPVAAPLQAVVRPAQAVSAPVRPVVLPQAAPASSPTPPPLAPALARTPAAEPARLVARPRAPGPSATPLPAAPPRPARQHAWSLYPDLKPPELPPNIH